MNDLSRHVFDMATSMNRALADNLANNGSRVVVQSLEIAPFGVAPAEPKVYPRCHADVFSSDGTLTITSMDQNVVVREFTVGEWTEATEFGADGHIRYSLRPSHRRAE